MNDDRLITFRERDVLDLTFDFIHVSYPALARFLNTSQSNIRYIASKLKKKGMVQTGRVNGQYHHYLKHHANFGYIKLTQKAMRQYGVTQFTEEDSQEKHNLAAFSLISWIFQLSPIFNYEIDTVKGNRSSRARYREENESGRVQYRLKPDAAVEFFKDDQFVLRIFIETDTGHEDIRELAEKIVRYDNVLGEQEKDFTLVLFSVFKKRRLKTILGTYQQLGSSGLQIATHYAAETIDPNAPENIIINTTEGEMSLFDYLDKKNIGESGDR